MKKWLSFICVWALLLPGVSAYAEEAGQSALRIEGEHYTFANQATVPLNEHYVSDELSGGAHFMYKSASGAPLPGEGYIVGYTFELEEAGTYALEIMASILARGHVSPYDIKINDGDYVRVSASNATKIGEISNPANIFNQYQLTPVQLRQGSNTISFRVTEGRANDGRVFFFLDYLELVKIPWSLAGITANAANHLFEEGEAVEITVHFSDDQSAGHQLAYSVTDYFGGIALADTVTLTENESAFTFAVPQAERGHYTVQVEADGNGRKLLEYFSVVMDADERGTYTETPFAADTAGGFLIPADKIDGYARALRLVGIDYVRERQRWSVVNSTYGTFDFSAYAAYKDAYETNGIRVLQLNHSAPAWAVNPGKKLPNDLLAAYEYARTAAAYYGAQSDWEFWNEPDISFTADSETADQYAAFLKATTIGARDSGAPARVSVAGIAYPPGNYVQLLMQNEIAPYIDIYNFHGHRNDNTDNKLIELPPTFKVNMEFVQDYKLTGKRVYASEVGLSLKFKDDTGILTKEQQELQARYLAASAIEAVAMGVDKHFWFVFPYYIENGLSWGSFTAQDTPLASVNAQAALTHALGEAVYLGSLAGLPSGVKNHVFRDGADSVIALWSEADTAVELPLGALEAMHTDLMGRETLLTSATGSYSLQSGPDVQYLRIDGQIGGLSEPYFNRSFEPAPPLTAAERVVLTQRYPESGAEAAKAKGYLLDKDSATTIEVDVYNFNDTAISGEIVGSAYGGWSLANAAQQVVVSPFAKATLIFELSGSEDVAEGVRSPVVFAGSFGGDAASRSVALIASSENTVVEASLLVPDYDQPALWQENISGGSTSVIHSPAEGEIQFDFGMGGGDMWAYPNFELPENISFADTEGIVFDVYFPAPVEGVVVRSFVYETNGSGYFTLNGLAPVGGWQQFKMPWSDFSSFGTPDDNFHLDPEEIRRFSIGMNTRNEKNISFKVRNIGVYTAPDTGLYSKFAEMTPAHNETVSAGATPIAARLAQGEIPLTDGSVEVLVDGSPVSHQWNGDWLHAEAVLEPGSHTVAIQAFDISGRLVMAKSRITAEAAATPPPASSGTGWTTNATTEEATEAIDRLREEEQVS